MELHYQGNEAFNRRDLDALLGLTDPDIELFSRVAEMEGGGPYHGPDGVRTWFESLLGISPDFIAELQEVRDLGDVTLARVRNRGHGLGSDAPMDQTSWQVIEWHHKKATRWWIFLSEAEALEAAGLSKQAKSEKQDGPSAWIETMRRAIEAWNREDLDAFLETWHPECEWRPAFPRSLEGVGVVYRGREGIARAWHGVRGVWAEYRLDPEDARVVGQQLVAIGRVSARGIASGLELDSGWSALASFRAGLAISAWDWLDRDEAFRAARSQM